MFQRIVSPLFRELFKLGMYKPSQGKIARRLTFLGFVVIFLSGSVCMVRDHVFGSPNVTMAVAVFTAIVGAWISYRIVNFPSFADFLVSVEVEMTKVSWPSKTELFSTTKVVLIFMFLFIAVIYFYDILFDMLLSAVKRAFS